MLMKSIPLILLMLCSPSPTLDPSSEIADTDDFQIFDRSVTIGPDSLMVGNVVHMRALINILDTAGDQIITVRPHLGIHTFGFVAIPVSGRHNFMVLDWVFVVIETGQHGDITGWGTISVLDSRGVPGATHGDLIMATEVDTRTNLDAAISVAWDEASPSNRVRLEHLLVDIQ